MKPAEFASLLCEKLEKLKLDNNNEEARKMNESQMPILQDQCMSSPYHHAPSNNMLRPSFYPSEDYFDDSQSWILPPASDRYSVAGASSHSGSGANMEKNRNVKEKAKELRNAVHHSLRNGLGECECKSCDIKCQEKSYPSTYTKDSSKHSSEFCRRSLVQGNPGCCCHAKDSYCTCPPPLYRKYNSEQSSHRTADYPHENVNEDFVPPMDNTKIYAWMELNDRLKHEPNYPDHTPSPAVRRKKQPKDYERKTVAQTVQPIAQDLHMPLLPQPDTGNVLEEVKRVLEEPEQQRVSPIKKMPPRVHQPPIQQQPYHYDQHTAYSDTSYEHNGSLTTTNWSLSDTHSRSSHNPSQISTVPSSASRLWNPEGYYDSSSDVRLEKQSGASRSHSTGTGRHSSQHHTSRSDHRSSNARADSHNNDMRSQRTGRSHGSDGNKTHTTTVTYYFGVEPIPYRISIPSYEVTLGQFKKSANKKGNFRFFFKTISQDDGEVVYEEVRDENERLPRFKDKIIGKVEKIE